MTLERHAGIPTRERGNEEKKSCSKISPKGRAYTAAR